MDDGRLRCGKHCDCNGAEKVSSVACPRSRLSPRCRAHCLSSAAFAVASALQNDKDQKPKGLRRSVNGRLRRRGSRKSRNEVRTILGNRWMPLTECRPQAFTKTAVERGTSVSGYLTVRGNIPTLKGFLAGGSVTAVERAGQNPFRCACLKMRLCGDAGGAKRIRAVAVSHRGNGAT